MTERKLRVAHILGNLGYGGLQCRILNLIRELPDFSHTVVYQSRNKGELHADYAKVSDLRQCPHRRDRRVGFVLDLRTIFRETAPDVVLAHLFGNHTLVSWAAFLADVPTTFGVSTNDPTFYSRSRWKPAVLAHAARPFCNGEIAVSESVALILTSELHLPADRIKVIPNGCPVEEFSARAAAGRKAAEPANDGTARLFMAASFGRTRDHVTLVRAVQLLRNNGRRVELSVAGGNFSSASRQRAESLTNELGIGDVVRFLGPRSDVPELMGASDIVINATHSEGFGMAVVEAMAAGVPVISTDLPACREVLDGGRCGTLVPHGDAPALATAVQRILDDEALRVRLVDAAAERVRLHYHVKRMAADYAELMRSLPRNARGLPRS
jgi:glycosyltransferase involved in cell wall biosynthesis